MFDILLDRSKNIYKGSNEYLPRDALISFVFNDGIEFVLFVDLPLLTLYRFNEQRPVGSKNPRGLYVAPRFEQVSTLFRLQVAGVNETEFVYEEYPKGNLHKYWCVHMRIFKRRFAIMKRNILKRYKERMKIESCYGKPLWHKCIPLIKRMREGKVDR